jgi:hypothetical protein
VGPPGVVATNSTGAFDFSNGNGFVAPGTFNSGQLGATGAGTRLLWYPRKAAFRAGYVGSTQWDDANIGSYSTAMGHSTTASGSYSTALGAGTTASGPNSTALGAGTTASGTVSTAMGYQASTNGMSGAFVYGDFSTTSVVTATANHQFVVRASGGFRFRTNTSLSTGCDLPAGSGMFACSSSRTTKDDVRVVDGDDVLARLRAVPVTSWSYIGESGVRHMGPFAEDFRAAFGLGVDDTTIGLLDIAGVSLAAVQALDARTQSLQEENAALRAALSELREAMEELKRQPR